MAGAAVVDAVCAPEPELVDGGVGAGRVRTGTTGRGVVAPDDAPAEVPPREPEAEGVPPVGALLKVVSPFAAGVGFVARRVAPLRAAGAAGTGPSADDPAGVVAAPCGGRVSPGISGLPTPARITF